MSADIAYPMTFLTKMFQFEVLRKSHLEWISVGNPNMRFVFWLLGSLFRKISEQIAENQEIYEHPEQNRTKGHINWNFILSSKITLVFRLIGSFWRKQPKLTEKRQTFLVVGFRICVPCERSSRAFCVCLYVCLSHLHTHTHIHTSSTHTSVIRVPKSRKEVLSPTCSSETATVLQFGIEITRFFLFEIVGTRRKNNLQGVQSRATLNI